MQSQKLVESPQSESSLGPQRRDPVEAISQRIEASRILFFCDSSIYTILGESPIHDVGQRRSNGRASHQSNTLQKRG
jgi:hypothetical protein